MSADDDTRRLAAANPTGWFEDLYTEAAAGTAAVPWDIPNPQPHLVEWASGVGGYPTSKVSYVVADLLAPPAEWLRAFDLVVENMTVQALPIPLHAQATERVASLVGDTLLVLSGARDEGPAPDGPPWPLTPSEVDAFATDGLNPRSIVRENGRWVAEFRR